MEKNILLIRIDKNRRGCIRFIYDVRTHPDVAKMMSGTPPKNYDAHLEWIDKNLIDGVREIYIISHDYGSAYAELLGYCQLYNFTGDNWCEVGYALHPMFFNKGYGKITVEKSIELAKERKIVGLRLCVKKTNSKAVHIYEKYGFLKINEDDELIYMENNL